VAGIEGAKKGGLKMYIYGKTNLKPNKGMETKAAQNELNRSIIEILVPFSLDTLKENF